MSYSYTDRDLLEDPPYHYMYARFEGMQFVNDYRTSRRIARSRLGAPMVPGASPGEASLPVADVSAAETLTEKVLEQLVKVMQSNAAVPTQQILVWIDLFARKFEASKRLRRSYGPGFQPLDRTLVRRTAYAELAFLIACTIVQSGNLRLLNTLLKLNDLVLSGPELDPATAALMAYAIDRELECVSVLAEDLHVMPTDGGAC